MAGPVVQDIRGHVHFGTDAVADVVLQDAQGLAGDRGNVVIDCVTDVTHELALGQGGDAPPHGGLGDIRKPLVLRVRGAHDHCPRRVGVPAIHNAAAVDGDDVSVLQDTTTGYAMDYFLVDGGADGRGESVVSEEVGLGSCVIEDRGKDVVQVLGSDTGPGSRNGSIECPARSPNWPCQLISGSSNSPATLAKGCIISRFPTRPDEFARPSGCRSSAEFSSSLGVPIAFAATTTTLAASRCSLPSRSIQVAPVARPRSLVSIRRTRAPVTSRAPRAIAFGQWVRSVDALAPSLQPDWQVLRWTHGRRPS